MKGGIFWSVQGEGHLRGFQMVFLRLAGCSVGCGECDTDYSVSNSEKMSPVMIAQLCDEKTPEGNRDRWVWITGGEPLDQDLRPLYRELRKKGFSVAVATSGKHRAITPVDWISVSYHGQSQFLQKYGSEIKLIVGLNGLSPFEFLDRFPDSETDFFYRYVQPLSVDGVECFESLQICLEFIRVNPNWSISRQDHIYWGKP